MSIPRTLPVALAVLWLAAISGCVEQLPAVRIKKVQRNKPAVGCLVSGRIVSTQWRDLGGGIERAVVTASTLPDLKQVEELYEKGERFEFRLPPGKYQLALSAVGTRGATFKGQSRQITVAKGRDHLDIGDVDLLISRSTALYGQPAPELTGIIAWQNTPPIAIDALRGKVVVLDFFAYYCTICHVHKPDLEKLRKQHEREGLVVLAIHDSSLKTLDEMNAKMTPVLRNVFDSNPPKLPMALDGAGRNSVFEAYGIYAVPAVILIDQQGRVVRRYHHAGKPELEADVRSLLSHPNADATKERRG